MRQELTAVGFAELKTASDVDGELQNQKGLALLVINSVCGCAAGTARPGVRLALSRASKVAERFVTVFAGVDVEGVAKVREYALPYPPSSPSIALFKDGELVHFLERHHIEGGTAQMIAENLTEAYNEFC